WRTEELVEAGEVEQNRVRGKIFHPRRKRLRAIEQCLVGGKFLKFRSIAKDDFRGAFDLKFGHLRRNAGGMRMIVDANYFLQRWFAFEHSYSLRAQFRFRAQDRLQGRVRNEDAGERHEDRCLAVGKKTTSKRRGFAQIIAD